jgi:flavin reductase (DIM6/NTAB) family NADH-FMN oxidoreductase RutF/rubredoxin
MKPETLHKIGYGMYIISSKDGDKLNGQIANALMQVSADPPTIAVSINKENLTHEFIKTSKVYSVSIIKKAAPIKLIGQFGFKSGRDSNKFDGIAYKMGVLGVPIIIENTVGYIEVEVIAEMDGGTHTVFLGKVRDADLLSEEEPMTYAYYHDVKKGKSPKTAPTYLKEEAMSKNNKKEENNMQKYVCKVCGYIYEPEKGDPDSGVEPGTSFEKLPANWVCPICGAGKDQFEKVD